MLIVIAIAIIVVALAALAVAWGREIDAEAAGRIEVGRRPIRRAA